jgi:hypothetical protein
MKLAAWNGQTSRIGQTNVETVDRTLLSLRLRGKV